MNEFFIQKILLKNVRDIQNFEINLDKDERKHLIITGKNACGKTSVLEEINSLLLKHLDNQFENIDNYRKRLVNYKKRLEILKNEALQFTLQKEEIEKLQNIENINKLRRIDEINSVIMSREHSYMKLDYEIIDLQKRIDNFANIDLEFSNQTEIYENIIKGNFLLAFFEAKRKNTPTIPDTITKQEFSQKYSTKPSLNETFIQYMLNIITEKMYAKDEGDLESVEKIEKWFNEFENSLKELFDKPTLKLKFYRKDLNFKIEYGSKSFGLNELSDGYSSVLAILTELILRMDAKGTKAYDMQGVVLIDEIETHLHVELQKKILPFFTSFFPKIQFIVTTHSPFVLSSLTDTIICDLEKRFVTSDLSAYSYDALIESYFDSDKYSKEIKLKIDRFEQLSLQEKLSDSEIEEYLNFKNYFKSLPTFMSDELDIKIKQILLTDFSKKGL